MFWANSGRHNMGLSMDASLSQADVERLLSAPTKAVRVEVAHKISGQYGTGRLSARERAVADEIFLALLHSAELEVREALAHNLKACEELPGDVLHALITDDDDSVAVPVLRSSVLLSDEELVEIIRTTRKAARHLAIAARNHVSQQVSDALVETGNPSVVEVLLVNENAEIADQTFQRILQDFSHQEHVLQAVVNRGGLPLEIAERLISFVSGSLEEKLRRKYDIPGQALKQAAQTSRESMTIDLIEATTSEEEVERLVDQLTIYNRLTPSLIFMALCRGHRHFFDVAVARLAKVATRNARVLMDDKGELGFRAIYRKTPLPESMCEVVKLVRRAVMALEGGKARAGTLHYSHKLADKLSELARGQVIDNLSYMLAIIHQQGVDHTAMAS